MSVAKQYHTFLFQYENFSIYIFNVTMFKDCTIVMKPNILLWKIIKLCELHWWSDILSGQYNMWYKILSIAIATSIHQANIFYFSLAEVWRGFEDIWVDDRLHPRRFVNPSARRWDLSSTTGSQNCSRQN